VRHIAWISFVCFITLVMTVATQVTFPSRHGVAYTVAEGIEIVVGTISAVIAFGFVFTETRVITRPLPGGNPYKLYAIWGLGIWSIFWLAILAWLILALVHPPRD
jgi:hypothetical protein